MATTLVRMKVAETDTCLGYVVVQRKGYLKLTVTGGRTLEIPNESIDDLVQVLNAFRHHNHRPWEI